MTPYLVKKLRAELEGPLICKPNAGLPVIDENGDAVYSMTPEQYTAILADCSREGADLLGGCCGTTPRHMARMIRELGR